MTGAPDGLRAPAYQAALLGALYEASVDGILVVDRDGEVLSSNHRFAEIWGFPHDLVAAGNDDLLLERAMEVVADPGAFIARVRALYAHPTARVRDEVLLRDGRVLDRHGTPLHAGDGNYLGWAWTFRDITVERRQRDEIVAAGERFATLARTLQHSLLPPRLPAPSGIEFAARYHPALEGVEVGGDFYDVFAVGEDWVVVLGDVCGKGPEAARLTGLVRWTVRAAAMHTEDPADVLRELNAVMLGGAVADGGDDDARFATVCCMRLRPRPAGGLTATIACAGHHAPLLRRAGGQVEVLRVGGMLVGVFPDIELEALEARLEHGDSLIVLTDGVLEARDAGGAQLEESGVVTLIGALTDPSAVEMSTAIADRALSIQAGVAHDDIAVLVVTATRLDAV